MTDTEFDAFLETCHAELRRKQDELMARFELGVWATWHYDQPTGRLTFRDSTGSPAVEAAVTFLGSFSPSAGTWLWGWANTSLLPAVRQRAAALQALADTTGIKAFRDKGGMRADECRAWELAAIAVHQLRALGCYKGPGENSSIFLSIDEIRRVSIRDVATMNVHGSPWPFDDPPNVTTITTANVLDRNDPILLVTHDGDDGTWQMLCGKTNDPKDGRVVGLGELFDRDPSIGQLADLPLGWALRDSVGSPWQRGPKPTPSE